MMTREIDETMRKWTRGRGKWVAMLEEQRIKQECEINGGAREKFSV